MRPIIRDFVSLCATSLDIQEPIYEFGALQVNGQRYMADLRSLFPTKRYVGTDYRLGVGVDVVLDLHNIELTDESVGTVVIVETLEHVEYPRRAVEELRRVLQPNGVVIATSCMNFPVHSYPYDFWRYTSQGFRSLFNGFESVLVDSLGDPKFPHTVLAVAWKSTVLDKRRRFEETYRTWRNQSHILSCLWIEIRNMVSTVEDWVQCRRADFGV